MNQKYILNFVPTGVVPTKDMNPYVPININEIIEQVIEANELGITIVHLHARDENGINTGRKDIYQLIMEGIKKFCPDLVLCVSLSGRNTTSFEERTEVLQLFPDMASLTLSSLNFIQQESINSPEVIHKIIDEMYKYGVKPELECFDSGMVNYANYLIKKNKLQSPYYFNLLFGNIFNAQSKLSHISNLIQDLPNNSYVALAGLGNDQLKVNATALANGLGVRIGLEDNLWYDNEKKILATNISLLKRIHQLSSILEKTYMTSKEFGTLGFYNKMRKQV